MPASEAPHEPNTHALQQQLDNLQQELAAARELNAAFFDHALAMLCIAGFDGYFKRINPMWSQVLGFSEAELLAEPRLNFVHPDDVAATRAVTAQVTEQGRDVIAFENRYRCKDGSYRWLRWNSTPDMAHGLIYAVVQDITAMREAQETAQQQAHLTSLILESMSEGVIAVDATGNPLVFNPAAQRMFGAGPVESDKSDEWAEVYGNFLPDMVTPFPTEQLPMIRALHREVTNEVEMFVRHGGAPEGRWISVNGRPLLGPTDDLLGGLVVCRDVTERRHADALLRTSEARFREIALNIPGAVFQLVMRNGNWQVDFVSDRIRDLTGLEPAALMEDYGRLVERIHPDDRPQYLSSAEHAVATMKPWHFEGRFVLPDGTIRWWQGDSSPLYNEAGELIFTGLLMDISLQRQAEEALRQNQLQEEIIQAQRATLEELSTPLIPITDTIVVMPLIGTIDSRRAQQVIETLLQGVGEARAEIAILDITGVSVVDTQVANTMIRAAQAVKLLGAQVMLTGIRPKVAQTLVGLGVDLSGIITRGSLQSGIALAMRR
ncbi:MAG: PAS domain S-box protein [Oscillochloridaceae bacterium umkhey_bin13]